MLTTFKKDLLLLILDNFNDEDFHKLNQEELNNIISKFQRVFKATYPPISPIITPPVINGNEKIVRIDGSGGFVDENGKPLQLRGWRVQRKSYDKYDQDVYGNLDEKDLNGNCHAIEIWWSAAPEILKQKRGIPSESFSGTYNEKALNNLLNAMRKVAEAGIWIVPSIRVSYDSSIAEKVTSDAVCDWQGWAPHNGVINNTLVKGGKGRYRDRFFKWLDWIMPKILEDKTISSKIAYWEMWHYPGHKSLIDIPSYFNNFVPELIAQYRKHEPKRMLGISLNNNASVNWLIENINNWTPYKDDIAIQNGLPLGNLIYHVGGYGLLRIIMPKDGKPGPIGKVWPKDSANPSYFSDTNETNVEKLIRLTKEHNKIISIHSQEGPGLESILRTTPIDPYPKSWFCGLLNLYNDHTHGFTIHDWPPRKDGLDETEFLDIVKAAFKGEKV